MTTPFSFESMLVFGWLASMPLIGVLPRARISFFQRFLFPGCLIGLIWIHLRVIGIADPDFKTPVAVEIAIMNVHSIVPIGACLLLVNAPVWWNWGGGRHHDCLSADNGCGTGADPGAETVGTA